MKLMAQKVYSNGTKRLDKYAYSYLLPKGFNENWKNELEYAVPTGLETVKSRIGTPGYAFPTFRYYGGRHLKSDPFPRKLIKEGRKREIADYEQHAAGATLVSQEFKDLVERLEPQIHQFEPVEVVWKDGSLAANMYFYVVCTALDSVSSEHTDGTRKLIKWKTDDGIVEVLGPWVSHDSGFVNHLVFDLNVIKHHTVWVDEFYSARCQFCSDVFKDAYEAAGLKGMTFNTELTT